jgi:hypothetical protein
MAKKENSDVELKIRVPKALMVKINDFRHSQKLDSKKQAVVYILDAFFSKETSPGAQSAGTEKNPGSDVPSASSGEHAYAATEPAKPADVEIAGA